MFPPEDAHIPFKKPAVGADRPKGHHNMFREERETLGHWQQSATSG
jgi:hypothetical protein